MLNLDEYYGDELSKLGSPDVVLHLAWGGLPNYTSDKHLKNELPKQIKFLEGLINQGLKSLVVTGTCFEYGMQEENSNLLHPPDRVILMVVQKIF